jgi:hypothetical protein
MSHTVTVVNTPRLIPMVGGDHKLSVNVTTDGMPANRVVYLYWESAIRPGNLHPPRIWFVAMKEAPGGQCEFPYLDGSVRYTIVSYDDQGLYDPVIKAGLTPEPME